MESSSHAEPIIHYTGLSTEAVASGLKPFTQYAVTLEVRSKIQQRSNKRLEMRLYDPVHMDS